MLRVLLTGFEPFGGEKINPSFEAIKRIDFQKLSCEAWVLELPVVFYESSKLIIERIHEIKPDIIIMVGQAGGRKEISIERIAINLDDSKVPDNKGVTPRQDPISVFGPVAYFSTLPIHAIQRELEDANIPCGISNSAGTYVCNHIFYSTMHELAQLHTSKLMAGFIHVPYTTDQVIDKPQAFSLPISDITKALEMIVETCVTEHLL
jgi:pyroglutamyl-peptidase